VGKEVRRRRQGQIQRGSPAARRSRVPGAGQSPDPRSGAEAALVRLVRGNPPGKVSLAGAYALGYAALGVAQQESDEPQWYHELDPLDTLFLGTAWPQGFRDGYEFANARTAWLRLLRGTVHWQGIERFIRAVLAASEEHDLPVDEGELMLLLAGRLEEAGLDQRKLPRGLLADRALSGARLAYGPADDVRLPDPPPDAGERVAGLWAATGTGLPGDGTAVDALREGLHLLAGAGLDVRGETGMLLPALYIGLVAGEYEDLSEAGERAVAWALGLDEGSPLVPVTDVLLTAPHRGLDPDTALGTCSASRHSPGQCGRMTAAGIAGPGRRWSTWRSSWVTSRCSPVTARSCGSAVTGRRCWKRRYAGLRRSSAARPDPRIRSSLTPMLTSRSRCRCLGWRAQQRACWKRPGYPRRGYTPASTPMACCRVWMGASLATVTRPNGTKR
jgi:hypothetical protein